MIDTSDLEAQIRPLAQQVEQTLARTEHALPTAESELSRIATEVQARRQEYAEAERRLEEHGIHNPEDVLHIAEEEPHEAAFHRAELSHELLHTGENVVEQIVEHRHHATAGKELHWYYAQGNKRLGPVKQTELLQFLANGDLPWSTLVWNKTLEDWTKASDSELIEILQESTPPPLPPPPPKAKKESGKGLKCRSCGRLNAPNDRFCAACGKPLRKSSK